MHIDNTFDDLSVTDRKKQHQLVLSEKVDAYFAWAKQKYSQVTHNSTIGKALAYSINQEEYLRVFLSDGNVPMDNNYAEQAIRPFTIGRKNFVMIESSNGAKASAILYSLVETAKANMINTFEYFNLLLTEIPQTWMTKISDLLMIFSHGHPEYRKNAPADTKSLDFSMYMSFSIKSVQSPLECGDFYFPLLMFEDLPTARFLNSFKSSGVCILLISITSDISSCFSLSSSFVYSLTPIT